MPELGHAQTWREPSSDHRLDKVLPLCSRTTERHYRGTSLHEIGNACSAEGFVSRRRAHQWSFAIRAIHVSHTRDAVVVSLLRRTTRFEVPERLGHTVDHLDAVRLTRIRSRHHAREVVGLAEAHVAGRVDLPPGRLLGIPTVLHADGGASGNTGRNAPALVVDDVFHQVLFVLL